MAIGVNQTWQDVTSSRSAGTTYTNSTGKPIMVNVYLTDGESRTGSLTVGGVVVAVAISHGAGGSTATMSAIVPNGVSYSVGASGGGVAMWAELR